MENIFKKILIIHAGGIGDIIMFTPALKILKNNFPNSAVDIFIGYTPIAAEVLRGSEIINRILDFNFPKSNFFNKIRFIYKLRKEKYDLIIVASGVNPYKGSLLAFLIGGKNRVGEYKKSKCLFYTHQVKLNGNSHKIEANLNLLKSLGIKTGGRTPSLFFTIGNDDEKFAEEFIKKNNLRDKILIGFFPAVGSKQQFKKWPEENFIKLGKIVLDNFPKTAIIIFGSSDEKNLCLGIKDGIRRNFVFTANNSLKQAAALIDKCKVCVSSDCGLGHVASTTKTNLVIIFGSTIPERTGPVGPKVHIVEERCRYRYHDIFTPKYDMNKKHQCLRKITPEIVFNKIKEVLCK